MFFYDFLGNRLNPSTIFHILQKSWKYQVWLLKLPTWNPQMKSPKSLLYPPSGMISTVGDCGTGFFPEISDVSGWMWNPQMKIQRSIIYPPPSDRCLSYSTFGWESSVSIGEIPWGIVTCCYKHDYTPLNTMNPEKYEHPPNDMNILQTK